MATCKTCSRIAKISGVRRRRKSTRVSKSGMKSALTTAATVSGGFVAGSMANNVSFVQQNSLIANLGKIVIGAYLATTQKSKVVKNLSLGFGANGIAELVQSAIDGEISIPGLGSGGTEVTDAGVGYLSPMRSTSVHSVAGVPDFQVD